MRGWARPGACRLLTTIAISLAFAPVARGQDAVVVACVEASRCTYQRVYSPTLNGESSVRLVPVSAPSDGQKSATGRSVRLNNLPGLYREPESGLLRVLSRGGDLGETVVPSKAPRGETPGSAASGQWTVEYREQPKSKSPVSLPPEQFIALLHDPRPALAVVEFVKREVRAPKPHPLQQQLIIGAVAFAESSQELRIWREELRGIMRRSLDSFRSQTGDPTRLEATLAEGVAALRMHRLVAADPHQDETLQADLNNEYQRLLGRFAIAGALKNAGLDDAFLEKLDQIGLARWSRSDLVADIDKALLASAEAHHHRATELFKAGQYGGAFDEARLASSRARCNDEMNEFYGRTRLEFVNRNTIPTVPEYGKENRSVLQQIVRELEGSGHEPTLTPERIEYIHKRISEGERLDPDYLPLQLKKAEFLANIGQLTASRDVVTRVERTVALGRTDAEEWLLMDATLNGKLFTLRQTTERLLTEQIASGQFKEALTSAATGLRAEPTNPRFLYFSAIIAAVLRDRQQTEAFIERYLRLMGSPCAGDEKVRETLFDLYRDRPEDTASPRVTGTIPNWISGEFYAPGEAYYDPVSGSFNANIVSSVITIGNTTMGTEFVWNGFLVASILTDTGPVVGARRTLLELEPVYDPKRVYMTGIGPRANSAGQRRVMPLRYLNSPDFDPVLASKFTGKLSTRGWAGNPFFHPFAWNDIYLFDLIYDDLGRIKQAVPVSPDATRPMSQFSEPLTFTWEGVSKRLRAISGARYKREMFYDKQGRLVAEKITHPLGKGKIEYAYNGDSMQVARIACEDDFYDKGRRIVTVQPPMYK